MATGDGLSGGIGDILTPHLSGLADITSILDGTPLETFLPSAFWPDGGIEWDWSSVSFDDVDFAVPFATPGNAYTPLPGIVVSGNGGQFVGTFAQTNDGRPAISVTDTFTGTTQTYMETASGVAGVVIDNGSYTGTFTVAPGGAAGSLAAFLDPAAGIGQFDGFVITDNDTGEVVGEGLIVGGDGVNELGGGEGRDTIVGRTRDRATGEWQTTVTSTTPLERFNHDTLVGGQVGTIFGSALSQAIPTDNVFEQVAAGSILAAVGRNFGQIIDAGLSTSMEMSQIIDMALDDFSADLAGAFRTQALGAVTGFLMGELAESLGFDGSGFGDQILRTALGTAANSLLDTVVGNLPSFFGNGGYLFSGLFYDGAAASASGANFASSVGSFIGGYMAREVIAPETLAGSIGAAIGGGIGGLVGLGFVGTATAAVVGSIGAGVVAGVGVAGLMTVATSLALNVLLPGVGAFVGAALGTLIGNGFEGWGDDHGWGQSTSRLSVGGSAFEIVLEDGNDADFTEPAHAVGRVVVDVLNDVLDTVGGRVANSHHLAVGIHVENRQTGTAGHNSVRIDTVQVEEIAGTYVWNRDVQSDTPAERISLAVLETLERVKIAGGDLYAKRALAYSTTGANAVTTLEALVGNLKVAEDYARYLANRSIIDALIALSPESSFAAGWIITLARAEEMGLDERNAVDFIGGVAGFVQNRDLTRPQFEDSEITIARQNGYLRITFDADGDGEGVTQAVALTDVGLTQRAASNTPGQQVNGTNGNDLWIANANVASRFVDASFALTAAQGNIRVVSNDTLIGGNANDFISAGNGMDFVQGGGGNDTINGGVGDDVLYGGSGNDILQGGSDNDALFGGSGTDRLDGGDGNDILAAGAGVDGVWQNVFGYAGDDTYLVHHGDDQILIGATAETATGGTGDLIVFGEMTLADLDVATFIAGGADGTRLWFQWDNGDDVVGDLQVANMGQHIEGFQFADGSRVVSMSFDTAGRLNLQGSADNDLIIGGNSNEVIRGGAGNDTLGAGGGTGLQYLFGEAGDDTYRISSRDGSVFISAAGETGTNDRIVFTDLDLADITVSEVGTELRFNWVNDDDSTGLLRVANAGQFIEGFEFADGTRLSDISFDDLGRLILQGTAGNDLIVGSGGGIEVILGGAGNDTLSSGGGTNWQYLRGQTGDDTYRIAARDGLVYIDASAENASTGTNDRIVFTDLDLADVTVSVFGSDLRFDWVDADNGVGQLRVANAAGHIEGLQFADGTRIARMSFDTAGRLNLQGTAGNDLIIGGDSTEVIRGGAGNDTLSAGGGTGLQYLFGEAGDDTYRISSGDGSVFISATGETGTNDRIVFTDLDLAEVAVSLVDGELRVNWVNDDDSAGLLRVANAGQFIEGFVFGDGTQLSDISFDGAGRLVLQGTAGHDVIMSGSGNEIILGGAGNDTLSAGGGTNWQYLRGQTGDDTYRISANDGLVYIDASAETASTGTNDRIVFTDLDLDDMTVSVGGPTDAPELHFGWQYDGNRPGSLRVAELGGQIELYQFADGTRLSSISLNGSGDLVLEGTSANDRIIGTANRDIIRGGDGADVITGGGGNDLLYGEGGADRFIFSGNFGLDLIGDFNIGSDVIDLTSFGIDSFADLIDDHLQNFGGNAAIVIGTNRIHLNGVNFSSHGLTDDNFII